jgi:hypothetical protein
VFAQIPSPANYDVTVSPVFFDLTSSPGENLTEKIRIRNNTNSSLPIKIEVKRLTGDASGNLVLRDNGLDNFLSWINFPNGNSIVAKPLEWTDIPFYIKIPSDAAYGYYFAISFTQDDSSPLAKTGAKITGAAAIPILLNVKKEGAKAEAKILDFSTKSFINEYLPIDFLVKVQNQGNVHIRPHGNIFISSQTGKDIAVLDVNGNLANIIPNTIRSFNASWDDGFLVLEPIVENGVTKLDKNGKPLKHLVINWNKLTSFRVGKYTANLILVFDNGTRDVSLSSTLTFWVIPWKAIAVIILGLIIFILLVRFLLKIYIKKQIEKGLRERL